MLRVMSRVTTLCLLGWICSAATARADEYICTPANVAVFDSRVHVRCTMAAPDNTLYFAAPTDNRARVNRILALLLTTTASGGQVGIIYDPNDLSGGAIGCQTGDCRLIDWLYFVPPVP